MKAVIFDLYETLVTYFDPHWTPPPRSIAQRLGVEERVFASLWPHFDNAWESGQIGHYQDALAQFCAAAGAKPGAGVLAELLTERRLITARPFKAVEPEIVEMTAALKQSGLKLGVITNANNLGAAHWPDTPLAPYFDVFVASHEAGMLKPDRRIYELACRRLGIAPAEAAFVGDGGANELHGAAEVGMKPYWCTWFFDRWPEAITPNSFPGDWRQRPLKGEPPYPRVARPQELLDTVLR
jgi:putative hydrolase of the HAD superfamily